MGNTSSSAAGWPEAALSLIVVCRKCDRKSVFSARETELEPTDKVLQENPLDTLWRVVVACEHEHCSSQIEVFTYAEYYRSHDDIVEYIMRAKPTVYCVNGHAMSAPSQIRSVEVVRPLLADIPSSREPLPYTIGSA